jgi:hypothetical protein
MDLPRKLVRPRQGCLIGECSHQHCSARGVGRTNRKLQSIAQERSHLFMLCDHFEGGLPPPGRRGRSIVVRNGAPLRKFTRGALELKFCCRMHVMKLPQECCRAPKAGTPQASITLLALPH